MLSVALDTGPLYGRVTGVGRSVIEVLAEFHQRSNAISVVPYALSFRAPLAEGTRRLAYPAALALRSWGRLNIPSVNKALRPAQLIHGTNYVVPPSRLPRLVTVHDCWALRFPEQCSSAVNRSMQVLRHAVTAGAHIHAPSQATADGVRELFPGAVVTVVPWATPRFSFSSGQRPDGALWLSGTPVITSVGTLDHRKNMARLVNAFAALATEFPDVVLALAGAPGTATPQISKAIDALPPTVRSRIFLLGNVEHDHISWLYHNSTVMAYPSLDEGFGFPVLEAMAAGTPVVAAASGSLPEIAGDAALLVDPTDTDALADALRSALQNQDLRDSLISAGLRRVDQFSWEATADGLLDLYRAIIESAPSGSVKLD